MADAARPAQVGTNIPFQRTRRITGYLVGTLDRFNNAKRCEERDRVQHSIKHTTEKNNEKGNT